MWMFDALWWLLLPIGLFVLMVIVLSRDLSRYPTVCEDKCPFRVRYCGAPCRGTHIPPCCDDFEETLVDGEGEEVDAPINGKVLLAREKERQRGLRTHSAPNRRTSP